jgi:hypothetical protein
MCHRSNRASSHWRPNAGLGHLGHSGRKVEAERARALYLTKLFGSNDTEGMVRPITVLLVLVLDPLAVLLTPGGALASEIGGDPHAPFPAAPVEPLCPPTNGSPSIGRGVGVAGPPRPNCGSIAAVWQAWDTSDEGGLGHCVIIAGPRLIGGVFLLLIGIALPRSGFLAKLARPSHRKFASIPTCTQRSSDCR